MRDKVINDLRVLVVDDDTFILRSVSRMLEKLGVKKVITTDKAELALKLISCRIEPIDVLISDLNMPELDGVQLIRHLGDLKEKVGLILISGEDARILQTAESIARERQINVLGSLEKPVKSAQIEALLSSQGVAQVVHSRMMNIPDLGAELHQAIKENQIHPYYQPQLNIKTNQVVGAEALARWHHPEKGMVPPNIFIPIAEQLGLIGDLTRQIYSVAFTDLQAWRKAGLNLTVSVNFSPRGLDNLDIPEMVQQELKSRLIPPDKVIIEVTESLVTRDLITSLDILTRFRLKGIGLSIDDFGTGFSTLEQLKRIPFTELKVDHSFVHGAGKHKVSLAILESSLQLAAKLDIHTVAEGVENEDDLQLVRNLGCELAQGYYYAKPMPLDDFLSWLNQYNQPS